MRHHSDLLIHRGLDEPSERSRGDMTPETETVAFQCRFQENIRDVEFPRSLGVKLRRTQHVLLSLYKDDRRRKTRIFGTGDDDHGTVASGVPCPRSCCASRVLGPGMWLPCDGLGEQKDLVRGGEPFLPQDACAHAAHARMRHVHIRDLCPPSGVPPSHTTLTATVHVSAGCLASIPSASSSSRPSP